MGSANGAPMPKYLFLFLQCAFRRFQHIFSAVALAEKGCFDEVRELRGDSASIGQHSAAGTRDQSLS